MGGAPVPVPEPALDGVPAASGGQGHRLFRAGPAPEPAGGGQWAPCSGCWRRPSTGRDRPGRHHGNFILLRGRGHRPAVLPGVFRGLLPVRLSDGDDGPGGRGFPVHRSVGDAPQPLVLPLALAPAILFCVFRKSWCRFRNKRETPLRRHKRIILAAVLLATLQMANLALCYAGDDHRYYTVDYSANSAIPGSGW